MKTHTAMPAVDIISVQKQQFSWGCQKYLLPLINCILIQFPSKFVSRGAIIIDLVPNTGLAIICTCVQLPSVGYNSTSRFHFNSEWLKEALRLCVSSSTIIQVIVFWLKKQILLKCLLVSNLENHGTNFITTQKCLNYSRIKLPSQCLMMDRFEVKLDYFIQRQITRSRGETISLCVKHTKRCQRYAHHVILIEYAYVISAPAIYHRTKYFANKEW